jgi:putative transposase
MMPHASFNKFTSHQFLQRLRSIGSAADIEDYQVTDDAERNHRFWQRDALAVNMDSQAKVELHPSESDARAMEPGK